MIVLPDLWLLRKKKRKKASKAKMLFFLLPSLAMIIFTIVMACSKDFANSGDPTLEIYLILLGLIVAPKLVYCICSIIGTLFCRLFKKKNNYGNLVGVLLVPVLWFVTLWGFTRGFSKFEVQHYTFASPDLPAAFDGYKIVQWSDAHVGTYTGRRKDILQQAIDSINAQNADAIMFTGDLMNIRPDELYQHIDALSSLKAPDGVFSVLGNHDYSVYIEASDAEKVANEREMVTRQKSFGWNLLMNEHRTIVRDNDSIVIAGEENDGRGKRRPAKGDIARTLEGVDTNAFIVMLQHDPTAWRRDILPNSNAQLTLSGHTHGGQAKIFGWSPTSLTYKEWGGWYYEGKRALHVSTGLGGLIPFRFGQPGEICVITLKRSI